MKIDPAWNRLPKEGHTIPDRSAESIFFSATQKQEPCSITPTANDPAISVVCGGLLI
jgi:hypothetical protein